MKMRQAAFTAVGQLVSASAGYFSFRLAEHFVGNNWAVLIGVLVFVATVEIIDRLEKHSLT